MFSCKLVQYSFVTFTFAWLFSEIFFCHRNQIINCRIHLSFGWILKLLIKIFFYRAWISHQQQAHNRNMFQNSNMLLLQHQWFKINQLFCQIGAMIRSNIVDLQFQYQIHRSPGFNSFRTTEILNLDCILNFPNWLNYHAQ